MSNTDSELLPYEDRQKWFRYHIHNSKVSEENAWKQINKMIRMLYKDYLDKKGGKREEVKQKYSNYTRNLIALQKN